MGGTLVDYPLPSPPALVARCLRGAFSFLVRPEGERLPPAATVPAPEVARRRRRRAGPETAIAHRAAIAMRRMIRAVSGQTLPQIAEACLRPIVTDGRTYADTLSTLRAFRERGYRLGLVSNTPWGTPDYLWEQQTGKFGLAAFLEVRLFSSEVGVRKPNPRIFLEALGRLGVPPARALFVGDTPAEDIAGAVRAGMHRAGCPRRAFPRCVSLPGRPPHLQPPGPPGAPAAAHPQKQLTRTAAPRSIIRPLWAA